MKMRKNIELIAILMVLLVACLFTACDGGALEELWKDELGNGSGNGGDPATYTVTYDGNGATGGEVPVDSTKYKSGAEVTVLGITGSLTKTDCNFGCWNTAADGKGTNYAAGAKFNITADTTLYAKWVVSPAPTPVTYTITLDKNGGSSGGSATVVCNAESLTGITHAQHEGYTLTGYWTETSSGIKVLNSDGTFAAADVDGYITGGRWIKAENCTLYAQWQLEGSLSGLFTVDSSGTQVRFSKGNLWYGKVEGATTATWNFENNQYDFRTYVDKGSCIDGRYDSSSGTPSGHWGLFGWSGSSANNYGMSISKPNTNYSGEFKDWGTNAITNGGNAADTWRTMTQSELVYLLNTSDSTTDYRQDANRFAKAKVNDVKGLLIFPDGYSLPSGYTAESGGTGMANVNTVDADFPGNNIPDGTWTVMESDGCVFLPAAGYREGTTVNNLGDCGYYWLATPGVYDSDNDYSTAYDLCFVGNNVFPADSSYRYRGRSVRLVCGVSEN